MSLSTPGQQSINSTVISEFESYAEGLKCDAVNNSHRVFLLFECQHPADALILRAWFDRLPETQRTWQPQQSKTDRTDQIQKLLGTETELVVYDATRGVDPRLLAATAGTLSAGGLYLMLTPPLHIWANTHDHEYDIAQSVFLDHLSNHIQQHCTRSPVPHLWQIKTASNQSAPCSLSDQLTEQNELLAQISQNLRTNDNAVAVIQADRGRGKSTLLARLLVNRAASAENNTTVTALHASATEVLQRYCDQQQQAMTFLPLQEALRQKHELLLVDEAATIPLEQLMILAAQSQQIVFATTVDGYEGAGRGFATRFTKLLDQRHAGWHLYQPTQAIRWQSGDPLESMLNQALLLKSTLPTKPTTPIALDKIVCQQLTPTQLSQNPKTLEQAFALLARAHYQTTAMDLRHMLDSPGMSVWVASIDGIPCAAALVCTEGKLDDSWYDSVANKRRRLKHQLLPQLLTQFTLQEGLLSPLALMLKH